MYDVVRLLSIAGLPIVFKGAMVTKLILGENNFTDFTRHTKDIDASWVGPNLPAMTELEEILNLALAGLGLKATVRREYGEGQTAGFRILDGAGEEAMSVDIDMGPALTGRTYQLGDTMIQGVTADNIIADKISALSTDKAFRRAKDLLDLYAFSSCLSIESLNIRTLWKLEHREIGLFNAFGPRLAELRHAYEKLGRVEPKPDFRDVFERLKTFLAPFIEGNVAPLVWDPAQAVWSTAAPRPAWSGSPKL